MLINRLTPNLTPAGKEIMDLIRRARHLVREDPQGTVNESAYLSVTGEIATRLKGYEGSDGKYLRKKFDALA